MEKEASILRRVHLELAPGFKSTGGVIRVGDNVSEGVWKMIADEGFELDFASPKELQLDIASSEPLALFAFSKYDLPLGGDEKKAVSHCEDTLLGWYSVGREHWGCWRAARRITSPVHQAVIKRTVMTKPLDLGKPLSFHQAAERVHRINSRAGKWTAKVYNRWLGKTPAELAKHRGLRWEKHQVTKARRHSFLEMDMYISDTNSSQVNATQEALLEAEDEKFYLSGLEEARKKLPASVDWREASNGKDYLEPVMDQGACGSCWAASGMRMITARHKIKQDNPDALPFSITFPLYCSEFNQGCEGGYGYLIGKWSSEVGLVPATCARYTPNGKTCAVNNTCIEELKGQPRWRTTKTRYLGGRQRMATEAMLMEELHERGPIVVGLSGGDIGDDFMFYSGGVYTGESIPPKDKSGGHAVALVGYGTEDGEDYWMVQNSWGADWGEDGYVRMSRKVIKFRTGEVADVVRDEQDGRQVDAVAKMAQSL